jgi:hypothetical protein
MTFVEVRTTAAGLEAFVLDDRSTRAREQIQAEHRARAPGRRARRGEPELDASVPISHDLRAPLRAMQGFRRPCSRTTAIA